MFAYLTDSVELFHTADGTAYVALMIDGHCENWPIRSTRFRTWFRHQYCKAAGSPTSAGATRSALDLLEARAQFDASRQDIYVRTAEHDGSTFLDLADELWRAVKIASDGWEFIPRPPARFRRAADMLPLPVPVTDGSIEVLSPAAPRG